MVVYEGPSEINGRPIVGIITGLATPSTNKKTGPMAQLWILSAMEEPHKALKSGEDESVCGDCPARDKWCYVVTFQGPLSIYKTWKRGGYGEYNEGLLTGHALRLGAYGDPAALPTEILERITRPVDRYTGYTHAWRYCDPRVKSFCMASCDTRADAVDAIRAGWRTFRVSTEPNERAIEREVSCPASEEAGNKLTCFECGACDGHRRPTVKSNIVIQVHGARSKQFIEEFS